MSWNKQELSKICTVFADGDWIETKDQSEEGIRLVQTGNVGLGVFKSRDSKARYISEETFSRLRCTEIKEGDILISRLPDPVGRSCILPVLNEKSITAVDCSIVRVKRDLISSKFLNYYCQSPHYFEQIRRNITGATRQRISRSLLGKTLIPFPSLATQQKIVKKLDAIFAEIDRAKVSTEANVKNAEVLCQSLIDKVITDFNHINKPTSFSEVVQIKSKLVDPKEDKFQELLHIGAGNIISTTGQLCDLKTARQENLISGKFLFDEETILYSKIRPYLKKVTKPNFSGLCSADVYPLKCLEGKLTKDFLFYLLLSTDFTNYAISGSDRAGMPKVNRNHLFAYEFNLPTISQQESLTNKISSSNEAISVVRNSIKKKIEELNSLKNSFLKQAFNGELVKE